MLVIIGLTNQLFKNLFIFEMIHSILGKLNNYFYTIEVFLMYDDY